jgi:tRNA-specific 2-thiouridylase
MEPILVAMSGGVDSSTAAWSLLEQGHQCGGATMELFDPKGGNVFDKTGKRLMPDKASAAGDAKKICDHLGIEHHTVRLYNQFRQLVLDRFAATYLEGKTPNPCVFCNKTIKFGHLLNYAKSVGCGALATGHYVRIEHGTANGRHLLRKAADSTKDQSYVLYSLSQEQLSRVHFPLGNQTKVETRAVAERAGLFVAHKSESQDLCFVVDGLYADFIERYSQTSSMPGDFVDKNTGKVVGQHQGIIHYTIGQRKGLGVAAKAPYFVCSFDMEANQIMLGSLEDLNSNYLTAHNINFIPFDKISGTLRCKAKSRYREDAVDVTVTQTGDDTMRVDFAEPQKAITSGQSVVLYDDDYLLGGGIID